MLENLVTEKRNEYSMNLDQMTSLEFCEVMNNEDIKAAAAVKGSIENIAMVIDITAERMKRGGRLIYAGAGTSGRLGLMDAAECVPTFGVPDGRVIGLMAGGGDATVRAIEGSEDSEELGLADIKRIGLTKDDVVIGIAASGRTPYVIAILNYANSIDAFTSCVCCNVGSVIGKIVNVPIEVDAGAEVLTGSTRLKSGTVQKLVLNMISTGAMIKQGKVYKNLMVDVTPTNKKLVERSRRIVTEATGIDYETADKIMSSTGASSKVAIVMILANCDRDEAEKRLRDADGFIRKAIEN